MLSYFGCYTVEGNIAASSQACSSSTPPGGHISPRGGSLRVLKGISWGHIRLNPDSSVWLLLSCSLGLFSHLPQETSRAGQHGVPDWQRLRHHRHCGHWWWLVRIRHLVHERYVSNIVLSVPVTC